MLQDVERPCNDDVLEHAAVWDVHRPAVVGDDDHRSLELDVAPKVDVAADGEVVEIEH